MNALLKFADDQVRSLIITQEVCTNVTMLHDVGEMIIWGLDVYNFKLQSNFKNCAVALKLYSN